MPEALVAFTVAAGRPDLSDRLQAAVLALESRFPGDRLGVAIGLQDDAPDVRVQDRAAFFSRCSKTRWRRFALRGETAYPQFAGATHAPDHRFLVLNGGVVAGSPSCMRIAASFVFETHAVVEDVMKEVGDALHACSAHWSPNMLETWRRVLQTGMRDVHGLAQRTPSGVVLPRIDPALARDPLQPEAAGWWNYWSEGVCAALGLPDPMSGSELRELATRTPGGACFVKLGTEVPEALTPAAMERLSWLYRRLPALAARR